MPSKYDLHLHTEYSPDCDTHLAAIEAHCLKKGLAGIAVTDHDTIEGALRLRDRVQKIAIIVGEEVTTRDGDMIGLLLREHVPPRMSAVETAAAIHEQGGVVYLPHPFDRRHARRSRGASLSSVIDVVDVIEAFNGKVQRPHYNWLAAEFAARHGKLLAGGSDAHSLSAIGTVYTVLRSATPPATAAELLGSLEGAGIAGTRRSPVGGWFVRGRRPFSLAWRRLRHGARDC